MSYQTLLVKRSGDVLEISLHRPEKMNAINIVMLQELFGVFDGPARAARAVLLRGGEKSFCAGQDLTDPALSSAEKAGEALLKYYNPLIRLITTFPMPVVASVRGAAAGAGCSLALAADIVIASETARLDMAFVRIGLIPDCGATYLLPRLVGRARAQAVMMLGEPVDGRTAAEWGLIWKVFPDTQTDAEALKLSTRLSAGPTAALALIKRASAHSATTTLDRQLDHESELQVLAAATSDFSEGLAAFRQKRTPKFTGG